MAAAAKKATALAVALAGNEGGSAPALSVAGEAQSSLRKVNHFMKDVVLARGALFGNKLTPEEKAAGMPDMSGTITIGDKDVGVAAWVTAGADSGVMYYRLSIGNKGESVYYGNMFRSDPDKAGRGTPDYWGKLANLPVEHENQHTDKDWGAADEFNITAQRARAASGRAYIKLVIASGEVLDSELPL